MWRWRKSEEKSGGHTAVSATTKWVQFKFQNIDDFLWVKFSFCSTSIALILSYLIFFLTHPPSVWPRGVKGIFVQILFAEFSVNMLFSQVTSHMFVMKLLLHVIPLFWLCLLAFMKGSVFEHAQHWDIYTLYQLLIAYRTKCAHFFGTHFRFQPLCYCQNILFKIRFCCTCSQTKL